MDSTSFNQFRSVSNLPDEEEDAVQGPTVHQSYATNLQTHLPLFQVHSEVREAPEATWIEWALLDVGYVALINFQSKTKGMVMSPNS